MVMATSARLPFTIEAPPLPESLGRGESFDPCLHSSLGLPSGGVGVNLDFHILFGSLDAKQTPDDSESTSLHRIKAVLEQLFVKSCKTLHANVSLDGKERFAKEVARLELRRPRLLQ